ncbi:MAG: phytanoyl-CoA dioxygenase family protein [Myxococcota bacterium]|nr:phytanoyl-CoA dioxygenase family protein [Myxococcota bacterium]
MLTDDELAHFDTFGFVVRRAMLSSDEVRSLAAELEAELDDAYGGSDGRARQWALMSTARTPAFAALVEDPRFLGIAEQIMPGETLGIAADASRYAGDTLWHGDTTGPAQWGVKFLFYFEPLRAENGALRVIPGSHREPYHSRVQRFLRGSSSEERVPAFVFRAEPGDVFVYDLRLLHASFGGRPGRAGGSVFYFHDPRTAEEESALREQDRLSRAHVRDFRGRGHIDPTSRSPLLDESWIADASMSATRQRWIARLRELGLLDAVTAPLDERDRLPHRAPGIASDQPDDAPKR